MQSRRKTCSHSHLLSKYNIKFQNRRRIVASIDDVTSHDLHKLDSNNLIKVVYVPNPQKNNEQLNDCEGKQDYQNCLCTKT